MVLGPINPDAEGTLEITTEEVCALTKPKELPEPQWSLFVDITAESYANGHNIPVKSPQDTIEENDTSVWHLFPFGIANFIYDHNEPYQQSVVVGVFETSDDDVYTDAMHQDPIKSGTKCVAIFYKRKDGSEEARTDGTPILYDPRHVVVVRLSTFNDSQKYDSEKDRVVRIDF